MELTEDHITIYYKKYKSSDADDMQAIVDGKITPVASVSHGHPGQSELPHTMIINKFDKENDKLIFKNTYDDPQNGQPKPFEIQRTDPNAPKELYFVHIEIKDTDSLPNQLN